MHIRATAIVCSARSHGEVGVIVRLLTAEHGLIGGYVAGGRGRDLRPVVIPGNVVLAELRSRAESQLPSARLELAQSRGPWLSEPLPAAAITWVMALTATVLPERQVFPALYQALSALLDAVCLAPSARGWVPGLLRFEALLLRELGYGVRRQDGDGADWAAMMAEFDAMGAMLDRHLFGERPLAGRRGDVMGARGQLRERLARIDGI
jgi:DNA repair protein RecO (recombination protein O)